jgi:quercetin dioxygenase-like cupin family protein
MQINHGRVDGIPSDLRGATFTGEVWAEPVLRDVPGVMINTVFFAPGARTDWHSHERGQILFVTHGRGLAINESGGGGVLLPGDVVWFEPAERHWHGADAATYLTHTAISLGETDWQQTVTDEQYTEAVAAYQPSS